MVKKAKWLKNVKKAFGADLKKLKHQSLGCEDGEISYPVLIATSRSSPPQFEVRVDKVNYEENKNISPSSDPVTTTDEEDVPADSSPSSSESLHPALADRFPGKSEDEAASILIQTTFRGYLGRRKARAMRGLGRLELYMEGSVVQRQAANTLKSMHTLARLQSEIRSRRILMSEENQARHKQLLLKHAKELGGLKNGGNWNFSNQSKEQVEASLLNKNEATMRRERGLAYAFTHQQNLKSGTKSANPMFIDPSNPAWGWSCSERWMAGGPWEGSDKEQNNNNNKENSAVKNSTNRNSNGGETAKSSNRKKLSNSTQPNTRSPSPSSTSPVTTRKPRKNKPIPPSAKSKTSDEDAKMNLRRPSSARSSASSDDERLTSSTTRRKVPTGSSSARAKSSERNRRPSSAPSSVSSGDERLTSSTTRRKVPTGSSARAKLKAQSSSTTTTEENGVVVPEKTPAKKRLSHSPSPAPKPRRSSAPPKVETGVLKVETTPVTD